MRHEYYYYNREELLKDPKLPIQILEDNGAVFQAMAQEMVDEIKRKNALGQRTVFICPVGPVGQYPYFVDMVNRENISLKNVWFLNMDEYLTDDLEWIDHDHPLSFHGFMDRTVYTKVKPELVMPEEQRVFPDPKHPERMGQLIDELGGVDICFGGVGINGHLAFNEAQDELTPDQFKEYLQFFAKLYAEGLLDPEMADPIDGDKWTQKMASGAAMATYAYYDQIGGVEASSTIDGFKLQMYPALAGPAGAHHQPKSRTGKGIMFPAKTAQREDFEQVVRTIDEIFFSEENAKLWCLGVEGVTYTEDENGNIVYSDEITSSPDGIYKTMQVKYGCGSDVTQMVWINKREMTKYDENYAQINATVESMGDVIQGIPPTPMFDDLTSEEAGLLQTPLADTWERWTNEFLTGSKSLDTDWDTYVAEMQSKGIDQFCELYQSNMN